MWSSAPCVVLLVALAAVSEGANTNGQKIKLMGHPPYRSALTPKDFYLFPSVKYKLRGQSFSSCEDAVDGFKVHV
ncbi:hypothetical protein EVAR_57876_1 [Eumeta japonica]|uniref:Uncharacterized protein n=1 Tax=Eumeta variegata TaxID=151549 RepID=A0A4C1ZBL0_EUMVA|nr:hypothetical protein EVAR_57876_1 [Eumeta japonica]